MDDSSKADSNWDGKKMARTGIKRVPRPKPERNVRADADMAASGTTTYSRTIPFAPTERFLSGCFRVTKERRLISERD